jgi:hypothetical protein
MRQDRRVKLYRELRAPGSVRVLEAIKMVSEDMTDDDDDLPEMPAGVLMKPRGDQGGRIGQ